jgi:hypothetical protein
MSRSVDSPRQQSKGKRGLPRRPKTIDPPRVNVPPLLVEIRKIGQPPRLVAIPDPRPAFIAAYERLADVTDSHAYLPDVVHWQVWIVKPGGRPDELVYRSDVYDGAVEYVERWHDDGVGSVAVIRPALGKAGGAHV